VAVKVVGHKSDNRLKAPRSRIFRKYALLFGSFVSVALIVSAGIEVYFSYQDTKTELLNTQHERAARAAEAIESFVNNIESQMGWTLHAAFLSQSQAIAQRRTDFTRLLKQAPAITEISYVDASGKEQLLISRLSLNRIGSGEDYSVTPIFVQARSNGRYAGEVYFRLESEPYMRIGLADRRGGVSIAEINLKLIWDVVTQIKVGRSGYGFAVDSRGLLISHPDISLVLGKTDMSQLPQVARALSTQQGSSGTIARSRDGISVLSSHAAIDSLGWTVFVESPTSEALAPIYGSMIRTSFLLAVGIVVSLLAGLYLTRRIVEPIRALQHGAAQIGAGNLEHQIRIESSDELEDLAEDFNQMTGRLKESYDYVERLSALKRYFSPHLAELIVSSREEENFTDSHRQYITVIFCDLRNFTKFSSHADPEVAMNVLREYFDVLGRKLLEFEATIDHFAGDGLMAFFNDPIPCKDPAGSAVRMAVEMKREVNQLIESWRRRQ
jgi:class 3 adenylate cyclase